MKKTIRFFILFLFIFAGESHAARTISSFPHTENFDSSGEVSDIIIDNNNANCLTTVTEWDAGGYSGGCVKVTPPYGTDGQCTIGIGGMNFSPAQGRLNIRMLLKFGSTYEDDPYSVGYNVQNKFILITNTQGPDRGMSVLENSYSEPCDAFYTFGVCTDNTCWYSDPGREEQAGTCTTPADHYAWPKCDTLWKLSDYINQWFVFEIMVDGPNRQTKIYLWTADGVFAGQYLATRSGDCVGWDATNTWSAIQAIGGFFNGGHTQDANTYIKIDNLVIDNNPAGGYIGPPAGFVGGTRKLNNVTGVRVTLH